MGSGTLPSTCYILSDESSIPFYPSSKNIYVSTALANIHVGKIHRCIALLKNIDAIDSNIDVFTYLMSVSPSENGCCYAI